MRPKKKKWIERPDVSSDSDDITIRGIRLALKAQKMARFEKKNSVILARDFLVRFFLAVPERQNKFNYHRLTIYLSVRKLRPESGFRLPGPVLLILHGHVSSEEIYNERFQYPIFRGRLRRIARVLSTNEKRIVLVHESERINLMSKLAGKDIAII